MKCFWDETKVDDETMRVYVGDPADAELLPAIVIIQHQDGINDFVQEMIRRTVAAGYFAIAPDLYHREAPNCKDDGPTRRARLRDPEVVKDVQSAVDFLKSRQPVDPGRLGIMGFCLGGRVAYLMAAVNRDLKAAVFYYGGDIFKAWGHGPTPFDLSADICCPVLGHFGEDDANPSPEDMRKLEAELTRLGKIHECYSYPNAGHGFMRKDSKGYSVRADELSWPRTLAFFRKHM
jgi:carboxymethylenebutenolidase